MQKAKVKKEADLRALGEERISRLVLRFSSATLVSLLLNALYGLSDALFVSWGVGDNAMGVSVHPFAKCRFHRRGRRGGIACFKTAR